MSQSFRNNTPIIHFIAPSAESMDMRKHLANCVFNAIGSGDVNVEVLGAATEMEEETPQSDRSRRSSFHDRLLSIGLLMC